MTRTRILQTAMTAVVAAAMLFGTIGNAIAAAPDKVLSTKLRGKSGVSGVAIFTVSSDNEKKFQVRLQDGKPGALLVVTARRGKETYKMGRVRVNQKGRAYMTVISGKRKMPELQAGDMISVWNESEMLCQGQFRRQK